jgi:hypothetical protein
MKTAVHTSAGLPEAGRLDRGNLTHSPGSRADHHSTTTNEPGRAAPEQNEAVIWIGSTVIFSLSCAAFWLLWAKILDRWPFN